MLEDQAAREGSRILGYIDSFKSRAKKICMLVVLVFIAPVLEVGIREFLIVSAQELLIAEPRDCAGVRASVLEEGARGIVAMSV